MVLSPKLKHYSFLFGGLLLDVVSDRGSSPNLAALQRALLLAPRSPLEAREGCFGTFMIWLILEAKRVQGPLLREMHAAGLSTVTIYMGLWMTS